MTLQNWGEPEWVPGHTWGHVTLCFGGLCYSCGSLILTINSTPSHPMDTQLYFPQDVINSLETTCTVLCSLGTRNAVLARGAHAENEAQTLDASPPTLSLIRVPVSRARSIISEQI